MKRVLTRSIENGVKLLMIYQAADGAMSQRIIQVKSYNERHVIAYCYYRRNTRMFRLDRILSLQLKSRKAYSLE
ncbi:WYL domain-containing protein [Halalkalibacter kiskunsagensis]|uniref:WYL domain-containing protein n=1 Tax=Halalkalibacter kiskunsagensis TaxID=1548599 RepID=A0ABV6KJA2_9BACI